MTCLTLGTGTTVAPIVGTALLFCTCAVTIKLALAISAFITSYTRSTSPPASVVAAFVAFTGSVCAGSFYTCLSTSTRSTGASATVIAALLPVTAVESTNTVLTGFLAPAGSAFAPTAIIATFLSFTGGE